MFIGMGLLKIGVLTGERSPRFYGWLTALGYGVGIPINTYTAWFIIRSGFDPTKHDLPTLFMISAAWALPWAISASLCFRFDGTFSVG